MTQLISQYLSNKSIKYKATYKYGAIKFTLVWGTLQNEIKPLKTGLLEIINTK